MTWIGPFWASSSDSFLKPEGLAYEGRLAHDAELAHWGVAQIFFVRADAAVACERTALAAGQEANGGVAREVELRVTHEALNGGHERAL